MWLRLCFAWELVASSVIYPFFSFLYLRTENKNEKDTQRAWNYLFIYFLINKSQNLTQPNFYVGYRPITTLFFHSGRGLAMLKIKHEKTCYNKKLEYILGNWMGTGFWKQNWQALKLLSFPLISFFLFFPFFWQLFIVYKFGRVSAAFSSKHIEHF